MINLALNKIQLTYATAEYVKPEDLDEAMQIVFGGARQGLLKPVGAIVNA